MFQRLALSFKSRTLDLLSEETANAYSLISDDLSLDSAAEDYITDQKVIILNPNQISASLNATNSKSAQIRFLISSNFAVISCFEVSYLQLQIAQSPFCEEQALAADEAIIPLFHKLFSFNQLYTSMSENADSHDFVSMDSFLEAQVQENQSKLRALGIVSNSLQAEIDRKDKEVSLLRTRLNDSKHLNSNLSKRLSTNLTANPSHGISVSIKLFQCMLTFACKIIYKFTKTLILLMQKSCWDLDLATRLIHPEVKFMNKEHNIFALFSHVSSVMFHGFGSENFGSDMRGQTQNLCNGGILETARGELPIKELLEHVSSDPIELLRGDPECRFSRFFETKLKDIICSHEGSSIFRNFGHYQVVLDSWRSMRPFFRPFARMASTVWMLHHLALAFDSRVEMFWVEKGLDFSALYMEDVMRRVKPPIVEKVKVEFSVVPGFNFKSTVLPCQVHLRST